MKDESEILTENLNIDHEAVTSWLKENPSRIPKILRGIGEAIATKGGIRAIDDSIVEELDVENKTQEDWIKNLSVFLIHTYIRVCTKMGIQFAGVLDYSLDAQEKDIGEMKKMILTNIQSIHVTIGYLEEAKFDLIKNFHDSENLRDISRVISEEMATDEEEVTH